MTDDRPDPDALLEAVRRAGRGRLKIFLGAAPGVGKTFEMLREGADLLASGVDVVAGVIETHGRANTERLVTPLSVLPRKAIEHGGHRLEEFDLDAMLARAPAVALIDELAHTNAPGSRHPKRWQDIDELRSAGIDVLSTLNIQHVESLGDVVAGFTGVRVRETVPDAILDGAEIEVVDLPPDELIERLKDGKVYGPAEATRALAHFFSKSNLSALRELALRRAAQTVDRHLLEHVASQGEGGTWAAAERLVVAIGDQPGSAALIRSAKRLADALRASWTAVVVETPRAATLSDPARARMAAALDLAAELGATIVTLPAANVVDGLLAHIREGHATAVVIGKSRRSWWFELRHGSVVDRLVRGLQGVAIHVVPTNDVSETRREAPIARPFLPRGTLPGLALVAATTGLARLVLPLVGADPIDLLYLLPVIAAATLFGLRSSLIASLGAAVAYNFFFLPPLYTLTIDNPRNVITLGVFVIVAVVASQLAGQVRREANIGARTAAENAAIAAFGQRLAAVSDETGTATATCEEIATLLDVATVLFTREDGRQVVLASVPVGAMLGPIDLAAVDWAFGRGEITGRGSGTLTASEWQFHPLKTARGTLGVLGVAREGGGTAIPPDKRVLFATLLGQAALAHGRLMLEAQSRAIVAAKQRDDLRATLLTSLGHDLKTPLTAVVAAADALASEHAVSPAGLTLKRAARRLRRVFDDLVEMTRIEAGALVAAHEATDLTDAVAAAVRDLGVELADHPLVVDVPPALPLVEANPRMLHHMLINLMGNAAKFAPVGTPITLEGRRTSGGVTLAVLDRGPGLPRGREEMLFDRFTSFAGDDRNGGTGLGLAIVKGFADAMGLSVQARNRAEGGSAFHIAWPDALVLREEA